ncbi:hypothetical protein Tco_0405130 [Tanacetum coccineum]
MPQRKVTRTTPATATATTPMIDVAIRALIAQGMADALAEQTIQRNTNLNYDGSQGSRSGITRHVRPTRECTYSEFFKFQPLNFKGTEGVIKKLEIEIWNRKVKGTDLASYTQRFQELPLMCGNVSQVSNEVEKSFGIVRENAKLKNKNHGNQDGNSNAPAKAPAKCSRHKTPMSLRDKHYHSGLYIKLLKSSIQHRLNARKLVVSKFYAIIGMDWLAKYHVVIFYDEKLIRIPFINETLIVHGNRSNQGNETRLNIISCTKTQKYMLKGCHVFLAHVTTNKTKDKSEENVSGRTKRGDFLKVIIPRTCLTLRSSTDSTSGISDRFDTWCCTFSTSTLSISSVRDERFVGATARTIRQRLYKAQFLTLGRSGLVCQEEGWIILNVHQLPRTEQANGEESLSTSED